MKEKPIFTIFYRDGKRYEIFLSGRIEGFPEGAIIMNRIPTLIYQSIADGKIPNWLTDDEAEKVACSHVFG